MQTFTQSKQTDKHTQSPKNDLYSVTYLGIYKLMLTKQNPQTYTKYKMYICTIYKWIHTYIHHTHTGTLTDIHSQTTQLHTIKHMHSLAQKHIHQITHTSQGTGTNTHTFAGVSHKT